MKAGLGRRNRRSQRAQSLVEFALVAPVLLLCLMLILDFGRIFLYMAELDNAAREGARQAALQANMGSNTSGHAVPDGGFVPGVLPLIQRMAPVGLPFQYQDATSQSSPPPYGSYSPGPTGQPGKITLNNPTPNVAYVFIYELSSSGACWASCDPNGNFRSGSHKLVVVEILMNFQSLTQMAMAIPGGITLDFRTVEREEW